MKKVLKKSVYVTGILMSIGVMYMYGQKESQQSIKVLVSTSTQVADRLNVLLATEFDLYVKALNYHWNVQGPQFSQFHMLFEQQYQQIFEIIDALAERTNIVGGTAYGSLSLFANHSLLKRPSGKNMDARDMVADLVSSYDILLAQMKKDVQFSAEVDDGTNNFLAGIIEQQEKARWMLAVHLK